MNAKCNHDNSIYFSIFLNKYTLFIFFSRKVCFPQPEILTGNPTVSCILNYKRTRLRLLGFIVSVLWERRPKNKTAYLQGWHMRSRANDLKDKRLAGTRPLLKFWVPLPTLTSGRCNESELGTIPAYVCAPFCLQLDR